MLSATDRKANDKVIRENAGEWARLMRAFDAVEADGPETTGEDLAEFVEMFRRVRRLGVRFDEGFVFEVEAIAAMLAGRDCDSDEDGSDEAVDREPPQYSPRAMKAMRTRARSSGRAGECVADLACPIRDGRRLSLADAGHRQRTVRHRRRIVWLYSAVFGTAHPIMGEVDSETGKVAFRFKGRPRSTADGRVCIYALTDEFGKVRYVGQTCELDRRIRQHVRLAGIAASRSRTSRWLRQMAGAGRRPGVTILAVVDAADADETEAMHIRNHLDAGCDLTNAVMRITAANKITRTPGSILAEGPRGGLTQ